MQQLASAIQAHLDTLVDQYDARLQTMPGYVNFPAAARRDLERQILNLVVKCLAVGDSQELVQYVRQRATHWVGLSLDLTWFQQALVVPEEILVPLIESVEASTFLWQALNRSQAAVWQLVADRLQQSEERFRRFSAATEEGLLFHEQGKILDVNPAMLALFGYTSASEIIGRNMLEFIVPEARALVLQMMQLNDVLPYEVQCIRKDGSIFPVETSTRAYQHGEKTIRASSVRDITKRKRAEEATRDNAEKLRAIYEGTNDAVMLLNEKGFFDCNSRTLEMFGFKTRDEFIAVHPADVSPPVQPDGQESLAASQAQIQTAYRQGYNRFEWTHRRANGDDFPAEVLLSAFDFAGQRVLQATVRDITERKQLERQIQESLARRERQVEVSRQVSQEIASAPGLNELFQRVVTLTKERFHYYHAQIFRYEPASDAIVLVKGYGEVGQKMYETGHQLSMGRGVVGIAAGTGRSILAADVTHDPDWRPNPYLPETKGELAVPIKLRDEVLGILDVQSEQAGALTDDDRLLIEGLCGQIAIAIENKRGEQLRQEQATFWQRLIDNIPNPIFFKDTQGIYQGCNTAFERYLGKPRDQIIGTSVFDMAPKDLADKYHAMDVELFEKPGTQVYDARVVYADGARRDVIFNKATLFAADGSVGGLIGVMVDITDRKQAEAALRASEEKYRDLINGMNDTICVIDFDTTIVDVNNAATRVLGYTRDELLSMKIPDIDANLAPDQIQNLAGSMPRDKVQVFETWHKTRSGERLPVEVSSSLVSYGGQTVILSIARDITGRKHAEEALRQSESQLSQALRNAKLAYWEYDVENDLFLFNDQFFSIFHTTAAQQGGYHLSSAEYAQRFVYPDDLAVVGNEIERAMKSTDQHYSRQLEHRFVYADGGLGYISVSINIDRDEHGRILRYYGANQDITERKQAEEVVRRSQAELSQALQIAKLGYWEYDVAKDVFLFNDQFYAIFHTTAEQQGGYHLSSAQYAQRFVYSDDLPVVGSEIEKALTSTDRHYSRQIDHRILYADGGVGYISVSINIDRDENGQILRYYGANQDITAAKLAEEALNAERNRLRILIDSLPDSVFIKDRDSRFVVNNQAHLRILGAVSQEDVIGKTDFDFFAPEMAGQYFADEQEVMRLGQPLLNREEMVLSASTGQRQFANTTKVPLKNARGEVIGFVGFSQDITERKLAEEAVRRSQADLSQALQIAKLAYWEYDVAKDLFQFNDQFYSIFHTTVEQEGGYQLSSARYAQKFVYPDDLPVVGAEIEKALTSTDRHYSRQIDHRIQYADGGVGYISVSINIDRDEQGQILRYYGANQDITAAKLAEEAVRRSQAELSQALQIARLAYWEYDVARDLFLFNDQFYAIFHTTAAQQGGYQLSSAQYAQKFVHPDDLGVVGSEIERAMKSTDQHYSRQLEHRFVYADGGLGYISVSINIDRDEHGQILRYYGANQDITERKQAEEVVRRSQAELSQALQIAKLGYWEYDVAKDVFLLNDQFYAIFHTTVEQAGGYQLTSAQYAQKFVYPDDLPVVGTEIEKALTSTDRHYSRQIDHRILYADGGTGYISVNINIDRDEQGRILRYYGANQDITDAKLAEAEREKLLTEQRKRALQLQTVAEVSRVTSSILSLDELLPQAAELVRARFNLYYVGIFLNDEADQWAMLRAGTGDAGQQMLANGHRLRIGKPSMISQCIVNQQARIALDVGEEAVRFDNPRLPMTRSELALPLISRGRVIGAVTIQSDQPAAFTTDDITILQTMADQIGNAIENARLYEQSSAALREVDALNRRLTGEGWETYLRLGSNRQLILARDDEALAPAALTAVDEQLASGQIVVEPAPGAEQQTTVSVPVMLRGQTIGALRIAMPQAAYTNELRTTLESLAGHVAQAAENARLLDETQARFARERALGAATEKIRSRSEVEHILKAAAEELAHYLPASAINVRLGSSVPSGDKTGQSG